MRKNRAIGKVTKELFERVHNDAKKCDNNKIVARANGISKETVRRILRAKSFQEYQTMNEQFAEEQRRKRCDVEPTQSKLFDSDVAVRVICHSKADADFLCDLATRLGFGVGLE